MGAKKYYWLKLKEDFFRNKKIKKLRTIAGGDTYTIIYLKIQLLSLKNEGKLFFEGIEDNFVKELALELDEKVENVEVTLNFLKRVELIEEVENNEFELQETVLNIGKETDIARRVRKHRKNEKMLQCNSVVTKRNTEIDIEKDIELELDIKKDINKAENFYKEGCLRDDFESARKLYPGTKRGLETELSNLKKKHKDWKKIIPLLQTSIINQIKSKEWKKENNRFVPEWKNFQTWINKRCWEEEEVLTNNSKPKSHKEKADPNCKICLGMGYIPVTIDGIEKMKKCRCMK